MVIIAAACRLNIDNRRLGKGSTLYLPVKVFGGLLSMGDTHAAQGDSEVRAQLQPDQ